MFLNMMQDWAGFLLVLFNFSIVLMWKRVRSDTKVVHAIWLCIFLHHAVAFLNVYLGNVIGTEGDARTFHFYGADASVEPEIGFWTNPRVTYTNTLGFFYHAFGTSFLLGDELSVLAFTLSCIVLVKLISLLELERFRIAIVLFFGLLPSSVIFRSVTLRESWQALFFLLSVYWAVRLRKRPGILIFLLMLMSAFCMALLHSGLKGFAVYLLLASVYWVIFKRKKDARLPWPVKFSFAGLLIACVIMSAQKMGWYMTVGQGLDEVTAFRQFAATIHGRTTYGVMLDTSSVLGLVKTIPLVFVYYMLAPFPWHIGNVKDVYAMLESMLRFLLLFFAIFSWHRSSGEVRSYYGFLLVVVLGVELMWALGTINWGTATRHHVPGYSVVVLLGVPGLILFMRDLSLGIFGRRNDNTRLLK
jgi:hypothetical protein